MPVLRNCQQGILEYFGKADNSYYYKGILQNLFFAMLNSPITPEGKDTISERRFRNGRGDYDNNKLMRHEELFIDPKLFVQLANQYVPFLNGGLFDCLDDKGFFTCSVSEIASACGCSEQIVDKCLRDLKSLEPAGIFSKDISECLLRQLEARNETDQVLIRIISDFIPDLLQGNLSSITRSLGITTAKCRSCIQKIGELNPRPIMNTESGQTEYIVPDILIEREHGRWKVTLNDAWMGEYTYNDYYIRMMRTASDPELKDYFKNKLERAKLIITSIERRRNTIIRIVEAVLEYQNEYFANGGSLRPMTMEAIAQQLDISTSTVSRAIKNKYIQYRRPLLLRDLFSNAVSDAAETSARLVRSRVSEIIRNEDHAHPLSDDKIAKILKGEGTSISRRTVAKYRQQLGIPDSRLRTYL